MKIRPFNNQVLLELLGFEDVSEGGILMTHGDEPPVTVWRVLDRGPGAMSSSGNLVEFEWIHKGMEVALPASCPLVLIQDSPKQVMTDMEWIAGEVLEWRRAKESDDLGKPKPASPRLALPTHLQ